MKTVKKKPPTQDECLAETILDDVDVSLMTGLDMQRLKQYAMLRNKLAEKYPNTGPMEDEDDTIDIIRARDDVKAPLFLKLMSAVKSGYDRAEMLQEFATEYEKKIVRFYGSVTLNWANPNTKWAEMLTESDIYEMVTGYFKILRKYGLTTEEEPFYFLTPQQKHKIEYTGDMLKRSTQMDDSEIKLSILEGFE